MNNYRCFLASKWKHLKKIPLIFILKNGSFFYFKPGWFVFVKFFKIVNRMLNTRRTIIIFIQFLQLHKYFLKWNESQKEGTCGFPEKPSSENPLLGISPRSSGTIVFCAIYCAMLGISWPPWWWVLSQPVPGVSALGITPNPVVSKLGFATLYRVAKCFWRVAKSVPELAFTLD